MAGTGKFAIAGLASVLVVAMVVAAVIVVSKNNAAGEGGAAVTANNKAAEALCSQTDYKETCQQSLSQTNSSDPKKLIQAALEYSVDTISAVVKKSELFKKAAEDPDVKNSLSVCQEVLNAAVDDLKRTVDQVGDYDPDKPEEFVEDLRSWLSAVGTYHQTCADAFENTSGDTGEKIKQLLKTGKELASNGLAMLDGVTSIIQSLGFEGFKSGRRLFADDASGAGAGFDHADRVLYDFNSPPAGSAAINSVVAQDGSGQFKTINEAIKMVSPQNNNTFVIFVKAGVYNEEVIIPRYMNKIVLLGEGPGKTKITGSKNSVDGVKTYNTPTVAINSDDFVAKDMTIENAAGPAKGQAVALRVSGDRAVFFNVNIEGYEDTLFTHTYRQFYRDCTIAGTIDFIFGDALAIFQNTTIVVRRPADARACTITAQGRVDPRSLGAIVVEGGHITAAPELLAAAPPVPAFLGRPWKELSRTVIMQAEIDGFISPEGWTPMNGNFALDTCYYAEFQNRGPGSDTSKRVQWKGIQRIDPATAEGWTPAKAFLGDSWIVNAGITYEPGMMKV
ncbi:pectinesterase-like [Andrographis paniculata]|uniref:pectinesterase-like n=1 Tax=Andrographis paniculata TaxID=175694 RepID=UPI0021E706C7|nr:pectinesterase-like [Andrographis paniculata]